MPSQTSSFRAYGLRAQSGRTAYSLAAILASLSVTPAYAVATVDGTAADGVVSKKVEGEKPGKGIGRGKGGGKVPEAPAPAPAPTVEAPAVTPAPTVAPKPAPTQAPRQAPTQAPKPAPTQSPKPAPVQAPKPAPTQSPRPSPTQAPKPKPSPTQAPKPKPAPVQSPESPRATPNAPAKTPDRAASPSPTPGGNDRASGEGRDDRTGIGVGAMPGSGGSGPAVAPVVVPGATPGASGSTGSAPAGRRAPAPRGTGGLVDRSAGNGGGGSSDGNGGAPVQDRVTSGAGGAPVAYREDTATGRRVYAVSTPDGRTREAVSVPGGVFGVLPSAAIEATAEVRGAVAEGGKRRSVSSESGSESAPPSGVAETIARPLAAIDEATGGGVPPALVLAALAAMAVALGLGIRREMRRW